MTHKPFPEVATLVMSHGWTLREFTYEFERRAGIPTNEWKPLAVGSPQFYHPRLPAHTIELEDDGSAWYVAQGLKIKGTFPTFAKAMAYVRSLS